MGQGRARQLKPEPDNGEEIFLGMWPFECT